jgi:hypothetical protein
MKKAMVGLVVLVMVLGLLLGGCFPSGDYTPSNDTPSSDAPDTPTIPTDNTPSDSMPVFDNPPPDDVTWISPGKVTVTNFYPGATAEYPVTIHNGNDDFTTFSVSYRHPDNVATGYVSPPVEVQDWVIVADMTPVLAPRETRDILVVLSMPENAAVFAEKWEFWVSVTDTTQAGQVHTAMAIRWLVTMRSS